MVKINALLLVVRTAVVEKLTETLIIHSDRCQQHSKVSFCSAIYSCSCTGIILSMHLYFKKKTKKIQQKLLLHQWNIAVGAQKGSTTFKNLK